MPIYRKKRRRLQIVAEVDILAKKGNIYDIFEVKCSHRIVKAKQQLKKIKKHLEEEYIIGKSFFYCGSSEALVKL